MMKRYHVRISGRVQGVFFRATMRAKASSLGLRGWVRNMQDGRVEAVFEGEEAAVEAMRQWCRRGTPPARVDGLEAEEESPAGEFSDFKIAY